MHDVQIPWNLSKAAISSTLYTLSVYIMGGKCTILGRVANLITLRFHTHIHTNICSAYCAVYAATATWAALKVFTMGI